MDKVVFRINFLFVGLCFLIPHIFFAQKVLEITITPVFENPNFSYPYTLELPTEPYFDAGRGALFEVLDKNNSIRIPFQISRDGEQKIHWMISPKSGVEVRKYEWVFNDSLIAGASSRIIDSGTSLTIVDGMDSLLRYQYEVVMPPPGVDSSYGRSGFIHPLWTPQGHILTAIQPKDHYHHYGIWNPWTQVEIDGDTIDFWNLAKKQGRVRTAKIISKSEGPIYSEVMALHEHVVLKNNQERVVLNEVQRIKVYPATKEEYFVVDFEFIYNCTTASPFRILEYRYEGLGWRTTRLWDNHNSGVLSSTGKDRTNVDGSKERWTVFQGALGLDFGGAVMMSHPSNFNHPEPMRVWPSSEANGALFGAISTTKDRDWILEPGQTYTLKYRFFVFDGILDAIKAEETWQAFAFPPVGKAER